MGMIHMEGSYETFVILIVYICVCEIVYLNYQ